VGDPLSCKEITSYLRVILRFGDRDHSSDTVMGFTGSHQISDLRFQFDWPDFPHFFQKR
jgi:hypothetical protein